MLNFLAIILVLLLVLTLLGMAVRIFAEYERGVTFRLGRFVGTKGPGLIFIIPFIDRIEKVSLRTVVYDVPVQEVITKDNVTCRVNAVLYYRVVEPKNAVINVQRFHEATIQLSQTTLRSVVGDAEFDELLSEREKLNQKLQQIIDQATDPWGIKVTTVEIKDVTIPDSIQRSIGRQAEAERRRRAVIIQAEGEKQAAKELAEAADILSKQKGGLTLRSLRTALEMSAEKGNTIYFPFPMEFTSLMNLIGGEENEEK
ncbi:slipin family protein [Natranaerobius thermophilus JW/NM-WN-LF]|uniref:SPFH domain, Band 7 family protein n=1 Tax=Natranaerobius thermophilus (strain ATCC BAA-1301 / DSM 18059 / JW/NM-WN-LF) TaxID=457570 RepID=B2A5F9_NATTJ|nr:slipin family protein [Natranaerobius thermophilus]ACB85314.1 SPFH domain, Band 7 family protein [Natranaerobius thermophilus JW/NM-WN-LF]